MRAVKLDLERKRRALKGEMVDRRARELAQIDRALEDLEAGRYGTCRDCEEPISEKRLKVMPFATRCVACQAREEDVRRAA